MTVDRYASLLARRVAVADVELGRAYVIHARNGGVGLAVVDPGGCLGFRLAREKMGNHYLFVEQDFSEGPPYGTAIPLKLLDASPPEGPDQLAWLQDQERQHRGAIDSAWAEVLGRSHETRSVSDWAGHASATVVEAYDDQQGGKDGV